MLDPTTIVNRPENIIVEFHDGTELPVEKIYYVGGRAECFKVLVDDWPGINLQSELDDLKRDCKIFEEEKESAESELEKAEKELAESEQKYEKELEIIQSALDTAQERLGIGTSQRFIQDQIDDLFAKIVDKISLLEEKIEGLTVDNRAMAWNLEKLEKQIESTNLEIEAPNE